MAQPKTVGSRTRHDRSGSLPTLGAGMKMFLNGTAMSGQADHRRLRGAPFLGAVCTAPLYRFFAVRGEFPGRVKVAQDGGVVAGELYELEDEVWRTSLGPAEPAELMLSEIV